MSHYVAATPTRDRAKIHELWAPDWAMWFPEQGDKRHGTKDDPWMVVIGVNVHAAVFPEVDKPQPVVLFEIVKGFVIRRGAGDRADAPDRAMEARS